MIGANTKQMQIPVGSREEGTVAEAYVVAEQIVNEGDAAVGLS